MLGRAVPECICLVLFLLCLIGLPPMPGFIGKFALIGAVVRHQWPVLAIAAQIPSHELGSNYFQETNPELLFRECSHYCALVSQPEQMPRLLAIAVRTAIAKPWNAIPMAALVIAMFWHAKLGIQVVIEDYVHTRWAEVTLQLLNTFACAAGALACLFALARMAMLAIVANH